MLSYNGSISSKLPKTDTTIFSVMSALAHQHNAINLSQGFPDFPISPYLIELVHKYMKLGYNQYCPMPGVIELREAISDKIDSLYGLNTSPEENINVTAGATQAIFSAISALIHEGDEVIIFTPAYDCYIPAIELAGGEPINVKLTHPDYGINWEEVKKLVNRKTKMIMINTPHNPTGAVLSESDLIELQKIVVGTDIVVLSDEVYEHIIFDDNQHQSVLKYPALANQSIAVYSFGKTFHATGWKIGYVVAPKELMKEFRKVHQFNVFTVNTPMQYALAEFIRNPDHYLYIGDFYQKKRDLFLSSIEGGRFKLNNSGGTYFQLLDYSEISEEKDTDFAIRLTREFGVASIPISVFYLNPQYDKMLRFCFAKQDDTILKAAEILNKI